MHKRRSARRYSDTNTQEEADIMPAGPTMQTLRLLGGIPPAVLVVAFAGVIAATALLMNRERREYALRFAQICVELAAVLLGTRSPDPRPAPRLSGTS